MRGSGGEPQFHVEFFMRLVNSTSKLFKFALFSKL